MDMDPEWLRDQLNRAVDAGHKWGFITVHGGEPCLHPDFQDIAEVLLSYKNKCGHDCTIWWLTNDSCQAIKDRTAEIEAMGIPLGRAYKESQPDYIPVCVSPTDEGLLPTDGCYMSATCGMSLNINGYWPCSAMAGAERVWGYKSTIQEPKDITESAIKVLRAQHCLRCGFGLGGESTGKRTKEDVRSSSWMKQLELYQSRLLIN
jgi:hypothetical protein